MKQFKIQHEREACIGCGACVAIEPESWSMNDDGKSDLKSSKEIKEDIYELETDELANNEEAAQACPVNSIHIYKGKEKKI